MGLTERSFLERMELMGLTTKPQTNADRIRSMSDEELAEFYCNDVDACPPGSDLKCIDKLYAHGEGPYPSDKQCMECWLDWLRQEAQGK